MDIPKHNVKNNWLKVPMEKNSIEQFKMPLITIFSIFNCKTKTFEKQTVHPIPLQPQPATSLSTIAIDLWQKAPVYILYYRLFTRNYKQFVYITGSTACLVNFYQDQHLHIITASHPHCKRLSASWLVRRVYFNNIQERWESVSQKPSETLSTSQEFL